MILKEAKRRRDGRTTNEPRDKRLSENGQTAKVQTPQPNTVAFLRSHGSVSVDKSVQPVDRQRG